MFTFIGVGRGTCVWLACCSFAWAIEPLGNLTGPWVLFVDDYPVETRTGTTRTYHPFQKYAGNPVLQANRAWEGVVYVYGTVLPKEDHTGYRMWYHSLPPDGGNRLMYAESTNGISWTKPDLGIVSWNGSTANNILIARNNKEHIPSVLHTPWDDLQHQYKLINYNSPLGGFIGAFAQDGIHFTNEPANPLVTGTGDVGNFIWDFHRSLYAGYVKLNTVVAGLRRRSVAITTSQNWTTWTPASLILTPDDIDDRWAVGNNKTDFYGLCGFAYESMYIGFVWVLRVTGYVDVCQDGLIHVEMVTSHDGVHWIREEGDRPPILPLGNPGAWDGGMVFTTQHPLVEDGLIKLYYGGIDGSHCGSGWTGGIGLATLRKDGFASLDAGADGGSITTRKLVGAGGALRLNYAAAGGSIRVEVQDGNGNVIPGYSASDCTPLQGDSPDTAVSWGTTTTLPVSASPLRLRFVLQDASIYSFRTDAAMSVLQPPSITRQPQAQRVSLGSTAQLSVLAEGTAISYRWQRDGLDLTDDSRITGSATSLLTVSSATGTDIGSYRCVLTSAGGVTISNAVSLGVGTFVFSDVATSTGTSSVAAMSADGLVVCGTGNSRPFIWTVRNGPVNLGLPAGATSAAATAVGVLADGSVVAAIDTDVSGSRARRWDGSSAGGGAFSNLPRLNGQRDWLSRSLGTDGSQLWIAGSSINGGDGNGREACLYKSSTNTTTSMVLPTYGHDNSDLHAVSDNGFAAGQYQYSGSAPTGGARDGFLYTPRQASVAYYSLAGATSSSYETACRAISRDGLVQGGWSTKAGTGSLAKPVIWKDYMTVVEIPVLTGGDNDDSGEVHALSADGSIAAGTSWRAASPGGPAEAFIWTAGTGTQKVAIVLAQRGFDVTGWTFSDVTGLSADGTCMCGNGTHNGVAHGWAVSFLDAGPKPPQLRQQPVPQAVQPGLSATFTVDATGDGALTYTWQLNGLDLADSSRYAGLHTQALTISAASTADEGSYACRVTSEYGSILSQSASLSLLTVRPDFDRDGDVDQVDFGLLQMCLTGPTVPQANAVCLPARLDSDDDVDQSDLAILRGCLTAPGVLANLDCD